MFKAALFKIDKKWKQHKCPTAEEWINKMCYSHTIEYDSSIKRNEVLTHAVTWMNHENMMLIMLII